MNKLLEEAKDVPVNKIQDLIILSSDELEVLVAYFNGDIEQVQMLKVMSKFRTRSGQVKSTAIILALRKVIRENRIKLN